MHGSAFLLELGGVILLLAILARVAQRFGFSPIPLYLLAGLAFGQGGLIPLVTADRFIAEGDFVVVEARGRSTTKQGKPYNNSYCWIYRFTNGEVTALTEYLDTALVAEVLGDPA